MLRTIEVGQVIAAETRFEVLKSALQWEFCQDECVLVVH